MDIHNDAPGKPLQDLLEGRKLQAPESLAVFYIRVNYEESKNIYWEMEVRSFFEQEAPDERILSAEWLTIGEAEQIDAFFASLSEYPALCDEVSEIIGTFLTEHPLVNKNTSTEK